MNTWKPVSIAFMIIGGIGIIVSLNLVTHAILRNNQQTVLSSLVFGLISAGCSGVLFMLGFMSERRKQEQFA
ncbi:MAG: hypothetical protein ABI361_09865 [Nitrososphaera sp.]|jgi:hypothetical protein